MIDKKFKVFQGVVIKSRIRNGVYFGKKGSIAGIGDDDEPETLDIYAVWVPNDEQDFFLRGKVVCFSEKELEANGEQYQESDFYDGRVIHVSQKGEILPPRDE